MKKIFTLIMMLAATLTMQAQDTWTVAGETAITGISWTPSDEANDMTTADGITYTLVKEHMMVKAKDPGYGYKVVKNHSWDEGAYPADNALLVINEDAEYTITFSFNSQSFEVSAAAEKTGEYVAPEVDQTWTVAGVAELCGTAWDATLTDNDMTTTDQVNYNWKKEDVALDKNTPYGFKVCADHAWDECYGNDEGGNYEILVNEPGLYTVEIAFNSNTKAISVTTTKTADHSFAEKTWTICGKAELCGSEWDPTDATNDMVKTGDGEFTLVRRNVALLVETEYEFKVAANHAWSESYGNDMGGNQVFELEEGLESGNYDVTFYFLVEAKTLWAEAEVADPAGVTTMKADKASKFVIYNLQGQRVANNYRGIAIHNGKKVVIK